MSRSPTSLYDNVIFYVDTGADTGYVYIHMSQSDSISRLRTLYAKSAVAKGTLDHFADRQKNATETTVDSMLAILERQGLAPTRAAVVDVFRDLEKTEAGRFLVGRKQHPSRFVWSEESCAIGRRARDATFPAGESAPLTPGTVSSRTKPATGFVDHPFLLRPGIQILLSLPPDLTQTEATRIAEFVKTLPFDR